MIGVNQCFILYAILLYLDLEIELGLLEDMVHYTVILYGVHIQSRISLVF